MGFLGLVGLAVAALWLTANALEVGNSDEVSGDDLVLDQGLRRQLFAKRQAHEPYRVFDKRPLDSSLRRRLFGKRGSGTSVQLRRRLLRSTALDSGLRRQLFGKRNLDSGLRRQLFGKRSIALDSGLRRQLFGKRSMALDSGLRRRLFGKRSGAGDIVVLHGHQLRRALFGKRSEDEFSQGGSDEYEDYPVAYAKREAYALDNALRQRLFG